MCEQPFQRNHNNKLFAVGMKHCARSLWTRNHSRKLPPLQLLPSPRGAISKPLFHTAERATRPACFLEWAMNDIHTFVVFLSRMRHSFQSIFTDDISRILKHTWRISGNSSRTIIRPLEVLSIFSNISTHMASSHSSLSEWRIRMTWVPSSDNPWPHGISELESFILGA